MPQKKSTLQKADPLSIAISSDNALQLVRSLIDGAITPTLLFNKEGDLLRFSKSFEDLFAMKLKTLIGVYNVFKDTQLENAGVIPVIREVFLGKQQDGVELYYDPSVLMQKGRPRWIRANGYHLTGNHGAVSGVVVLFEDITEIKENRDKVTKNKRLLNDFINSSEDALVIYDNNLKYIEINKAAREWINKPKHEIIGKHISEVIPGIEKTTRYQKYLEVMETGKPCQIEVSNHPLASGISLLIKAFKIDDGLGLITSDITQTKDEYNKEVSRKNDLKVLRDSAMDLVELGMDDDLYTYTANKLSAICHCPYVLINVLDENTNQVVVKAVSAGGKQKKLVSRLIGANLTGKAFPFYKNHELLKTAKLFKIEHGLYEIAGGELSKSICQTIEKALGIKQLYSIGFVRKGNLYGNALLLAGNMNEKLNTPLVEAFIHQISIAIHRFKSEKALIDSETRFKMAFVTSPDSVNINRLKDGVYVDINDGFTEITGFTRDDVIGISSLEKDIWVNPADRKHLVKELEEKGFVKNMEAEFRTKKGDIKVGLMSAHRFKKDGEDHIISITRDITDRKKYEESLQQSEERYRIVTKQTGQIVYDYNILNGEISWVGAIEEVTGYSVEEFQKVNIQEWEKKVHPEDIESALHGLNEAIESKGRYNAEYRFKRKDGTYANIEEHGICIADEATGSFRMLGSMADITERKKDQQNLEIAWHKAQESDKLKTAFLANLSHEIRTPMNAILGFSDLLMKENARESDKRDYIQMINRSSYNLLNIINDIIDFSMIETGQLHIYYSECSVQSILQELFKTFSQQMHMENKDHIKLIMKDVPDLNDHIISSDEERIKQVLSNLIANAIKYTEEGEISFGCRIRKRKNAESILEFFVSDTGIGIPPEKHNVIFERFRQLDISNTRKYGGNGLGLSISKQIAGLMNGEIFLESQPGKGSTFYFRIPYLKVKSPKLKNQFWNDKYFNWGHKRIIVAEDVQSNFFLIESILEDTGIQIDRAKDGLEAVNLFRQDIKYDLILMDIRMPELNGYEATDLIRIEDTKIPIIALSANAMQKDIETSISRGCNDHISKPINKEILFEKLAKYLN